MKPEMEDVELAQLELRLRKSVVGHAPAAPDALVRFIDTVPVTEPAARRLSLVHARPGVRRAFFALAAAAVLVVAVAGTAALVTIRNEQSRGIPAAGDGWSWQKGAADGPAVTVIYGVSRGFVGVCTGDSGTQLVCSSTDGISWAVPADPTIFTVGGTEWFLPWRIVRSGDVYVASGERQSCGPTGICKTPVPATSLSDVGKELWRSTDGVRWSRVDSPAFSGLYGLQVGVISGGFVAVGLASDGTGTGTDWALTSTDGLTWSRSSQLPVKPGVGWGAPPVGATYLLPGSHSGRSPLWAPGSEAACVSNGSASQPLEWCSLDGRSWAQVHLPGGIGFASGGRISDGSYLGLGFVEADLQGAVGIQSDLIVRSADGLTWYIDQGSPEGSITGETYVGGHLVISVSDSQASLASASAPAPALTSSIWESLDLGHTWRPLLDATGRQMKGMVGQVGDRLAIYSSPAVPSGQRIILLGSPEDASPTATASSSPTPSPVSSPSTSPLPSGGISRADAIRIAAEAASATQAEIDGASAEVVFGDRWWADAKDYRWVWKVVFTEVAGPTSGRQATVIIDYLTGSVITVRDLYA